MKIMTILGTRPEIIRLSLVIRKLDKYADHILVHTGQNFDIRLSQIFFDELGLRQPNHYLGVRGKVFPEQIARIIEESGKLLLEIRPDSVLILGDTYSGLSSIIARQMGIPVFHMEAGNRCYDDRVPEEVNRRIIDHCSSIWMPYTQKSKENLLREGIPNERIYVIGNPIYEVIEYFSDKIEASPILAKLGLAPQKYFLVTMHRAENVDVPIRLSGIIESLNLLRRNYDLPVVCSLHPRTKDKMEKIGLLKENKEIRFMAPLGYFDFVALEKNAFCVISDSGTVQEECCIFNVKNVTSRDVTERPETIDCGSNILAGTDPNTILQCVGIVVDQPADWTPPPEYLERHVSSKVVKIVLGYYQA